MNARAPLVQTFFDPERLEREVQARRDSARQRDLVAARAALEETERLRDAVEAATQDGMSAGYRLGYVDGQRWFLAVGVVAGCLITGTLGWLAITVARALGLAT